MSLNVLVAFMGKFKVRNLASLRLTVIEIYLRN